MASKKMLAKKASAVVVPLVLSTAACGDDGETTSEDAWPSEETVVG